MRGRILQDLFFLTLEKFDRPSFRAVFHRTDTQWLRLKDVCNVQNGVARPSYFHAGGLIYSCTLCSLLPKISTSPIPFSKVTAPTQEAIECVWWIVSGWILAFQVNGRLEKLAGAIDLSIKLSMFLVR